MHICGKWLKFISIGLSLTITANAQTDEHKLTLITEHNPPHSFIDAETGKIVGVAVDITRSLMATTKTNYTLLMLPWKRAYRQAQTETNTCVFPINHTPDRENMFQWISPTQVGGWAIFQRPDDTIILNSIEDVSRYALVGRIGSPATAEIEKIVGRKVLKTGADEDSIQLLYRGRTDLWVSGIYDAPAAALKMNMKPPKVAFHWKPATFGIACSKKTDLELIKPLVAANQARLAAIEQARLLSNLRQ